MSREPDSNTDTENAPSAGNPNIAGRDMRTPYDPGSTRWRDDSAYSTCDNNNYKDTLNVPDMPVRSDDK